MCYFLKIITLILGRFAVNTYIVFKEGSRECVVIDPGDGFDRIQYELKKNSLTPKGIILTHSHFDHIGSLWELAVKYNCPIYNHIDDVEMLSDSIKNLSAHFCDNPIEIFKTENTLEDNEVFKVAGLTFETLHTPGHVKGCAVYKCENVLFTGDTLFDGCCGRCDLWSSSVEDMRASLDRLFKLDDSFEVLSGHGNPTTIGEQRNSYKTFI